MPEQPPRRRTMRDFFDEICLDPSPEALALFIDQFGPLDQEICPVTDLLREFEDEIGKD
jgi:hypothetical protein